MAWMCRKTVGVVTLLAEFTGDNQTIMYYTAADFV
jgi:hypothetical protein